MQAKQADHRPILRIFRDLNAFKCREPRVLYEDLYEQWRAQGRRADEFEAALDRFIADGLGRLDCIDGEVVVELSAEGVERTWRLYAPGAGLAAVLRRWFTGGGGDAPPRMGLPSAR